MIQLKNVSKIYYNKGNVATGFSRVNLNLNIGEFVVIVGESGSGKSTLLNVISGLDSYEEGEMYINSKETSHYAEVDFEEYRRKYIANIFQAFNLVNSYTVMQNVELVMLIHGYDKKTSKEKIINILKDVGIYDLRNKKVSKLSGGQKQRVAIARALAKETPVIVADEPTGNLDKKSADAIFKLLNKIAQDKLVVVVTHNFEQVKDYATRVIRMHDGKIIEDKVVREWVEKEVHESVHKQMSLKNKLYLAVRNTFNIASKFAIVFAVFALISLVLLGQYGDQKHSEYKDFEQGISTSFNYRAVERIVVKHKDKSPITDEEFISLQKMNNVASIIKNDLLTDNLLGIQYGLRSYNFFEGFIRDIDNYDGKLDFGNMPRTTNEIIVVGRLNSNELKQFKDVFLNEEGYPGALMYDFFDKLTPIKVVGGEYDSNYAQDYVTFYMSKDLIEKICDIFGIYGSNYVIKVNGVTSDIFYQPIGVSDVVPVGQVYLPSYFVDKCSSGCIGEDVNIENNNVYYNKSIDLKIGKLYDFNNISEIFNIDASDVKGLKYYINPIDAEKIIDRRVYQASVFVSDVNRIDTIVNELNKLGFEALPIKDTFKVENDLLKMFKYISFILLIILFVVIFFVSYLIIYLVLKSRNTYFAIVRILGGSVKLSKQLISLELAFTMTLAFIVTVITSVIIYQNDTSIYFISSFITYLKWYHYIFVYAVLILLSQLIAHKFSNKIFKDSMITTYNMEV